MNKFNVVLARNIESVPKVIYDFSQTVAFSHYNYLSAQLPIEPSTGKLVQGGIQEQALQCFKNIEAIVMGINHIMSDIIRITIFTKSLKDVDAVKEVYKTFFTTYLPTMTIVVVKNIPMNSLVQVEAVMTCGEGTIPNAPQAGDLIKIARNTENAPICDFSSQTVAFSHYNNITTQLPIDLKTGKLVEGGIQDQVKQALRNIKNILESIDVPMDDIVKTTIFVKDLNLKNEVKEAYKTFFPDSAIARTVGYFPACSFIEVEEISLDSLVQIEVVVSHGDGTPPQQVEDRHGLVIKANNTDKAPKNCFSTQTVAFSHYNHISAQLPIDINGDIKEQTLGCLENIKNIVESIEHKMDDIVKLNIFVKNLKDMDIASPIIKSFFSKTMPAGRVVEVSNIEKNALIQIEAVVSNAEGTPPKQNK